MKKTLTILLVSVLAISTVIGGAAVAKTISTNKADTLPTQIATSVSETQAQKTEATQLATQAETQTATQVETTTANSSKTENTSNAQTNAQSEDGMSLIGVCYRNMSNPDHCSIEIKNIYGNTIDFKISSSNESYSKIATANVSVTFDNVDEYGIPYGTSNFEYEDSHGGTGSGEIDFNSSRIILNITQYDNTNTLWNISNASGKYL